MKTSRLAFGILAGVALLYSACAIALEQIFINPTSPRTNDRIIVYFPARGCGGEWPYWSIDGSTIEIVVLFADECLSSFYSSLDLGKLPAGNYAILLYYQEKGSRSRSFVRSELFSVNPAR